MVQSLRIGTRGSQLALWQANWIRDQIMKEHPKIFVELVIIKTQGDKIVDRPLAAIGGKGLFVKELETAMFEHKIDLAVHSMKDMPSFLPSGLEISIITRREVPQDGLVSPKFSNLESLPQNALVGTSSLRRAAQLKAYRSDLQIKNLRGNVDTRLKKVQDGEYDAAIMAVSGFKRLGLEKHIEPISIEVMLPAIAQGAIGLETRSDDESTFSCLSHLHDQETADCVRAERSVLKVLEGNCQVPIAGYCELQKDRLKLKALVVKPDGSQSIFHEGIAHRDDGEKLGESTAQLILEKGGRAILDGLKENPL